MVVLPAGMHKVKRKETVFSISREYGITEAELIAANPELRGENKIKKGSFLCIPYPSSPSATQQDTPRQAAPSDSELFSENTRSSKRINVIKAAVVLPFLPDGASKSESAKMVEYYEGFLISVDNLKRQGVSVNLYTYDTKGSANVISNILSKPEMKNMDIIFGPVHTSNIEPLANFAERNKIRLVVPFAPKVDQVFNNPMVYQINTPQSYFYSEAYDHFLRKFSKARIIFVDPANGDKEKNEFINGLKSELKDNRVDFKQIQLSSEIAPERIIAAMDTLRENIFIPTSGRSSALTRILPQLTNVLRSHPHFDMHLFGYPEWQTYTQEHLASFYELDTYFYSSFYTNNLFPEAVRFTQSYRRWYSKDMANTFPKYGMLGFDTGYFFLKGLSQQGNKFEENLDKVSVTPIQTGFKFERVNNWGGFINRKVFFVHLTKNYELIKLDFE
jgi:LysM repeat protein